MKDALITLLEALDPHHQGASWPDPIEWDGRPLDEQATDLLALADARIDADPEWDDAYQTRIRVAAGALRAVLA